MPTRLYVVHGSHPCAVVARAMDMKAVPYEVVELLSPLHAALQRMRFGTRTVPGLRLESGEKISGSRAIVRRLEELAPEPPLFPADAQARAEVERAEAWADADHALGLFAEWPGSTPAGVFPPAWVSA